MRERTLHSVVDRLRIGSSPWRLLARVVDAGRWAISDPIRLRSGPGDVVTGATGLAAAVRSGRRSAVDVLDEHLEVIGARDGEIRAFLHVDPDAARRTAAEVDEAVARGDDPGPLAGVPIALKDNLCVQGVPTTCASRMLEGWRPPYTATVVERVVAAGGVPIGKVNLDEFAMGSSTENSAFWPTRNPHDLSRVPGGSSGGSAAAVAAGFAPLALGSDTGGSIRQPASLCGVVGVKPTYGAVSRSGLVAFASSLDQIGPLAETVTDTAMLLDVIAAHDPLDSTSIPGGIPAVTPSLEQGIEGLRIGIVRELSGARGVQSGVREALDEAAASLERAGATLKVVSLPNVVHALAAYYLLAPAEASSNLARYDGEQYGLRIPAADVEQMNARSRDEGFGPEVKRRIMLGTYALSAGYYEAYYGQAQRARTLIMRDFEASCDECDVWLAPTSPTTAFELGAKTEDPLTMYLNDVCTIPANLTGYPAISVPFGVDTGGLPIGVQILAPPLEEPRMFRTARALEDARP